ncbi:S-adenosyl-L-methionine-dependent methyltransferase [Fomitopsis serialis]|uniref:S-adenosyl-L-methionine-dependent methyltransferase n=1 Tax=Fomitopsis serialis TaxID=139415 RepID=UPI0020074905|nr:S-adenosyl-L-methionine-dependent methyltransferase [Neoantrodia serialis]KAH9925251.1 S-adenosyl-L-methionine-dependent methyltransferase [Neoantrodia serialis]
MPVSRSTRVQKLRSLIRLLVDTSEVVIEEWEAEERHSSRNESATPNLVSHKLFEARRVIHGACAMCIDLVEDPRVRLQEISESFALSQAFDTTVRAGVPDILAEAEAPASGVSARQLSLRTGIDEKKLVRVMHFLCSGGIYDEVGVQRFANTNLSGVLVGNPQAKAMQCLFGTKLFVEALEHLPATLLDPETASSTSVTVAAFQRAQKTGLSLFDFMARSDETDAAILETGEMFPEAMFGQSQISSLSLIHDFPWGSLGKGTVVDVGGGIGSMSLTLAKAFPDLCFVVEDLPITIEKARPIWQTGYPGAVESGRVRLLPHDFFTEQPVQGAAAYFLRSVLHDWPDDDCVQILSRLRDVMSPESRILVADMIVQPPLGSAHFKAAPAPLPANYGRADLIKGMHDMVMLSLLNGAERTPEQLEAVANRAGLKVVKIWECRGPVSITELRRLPV